jgi:hypothetical protein
VKTKILTKVCIVFIFVTALIVAPVVFVPKAISSASAQATTTPTQTTNTYTTTTQTTTASTKTLTQTTTTPSTTTPTFTPTLHGRSVDIYFNDRLATWGDALPFIQSVPPSRTMVPIRFFAESIDAEVSWDGVNKEVTVKVDATLTYDHLARQVKMRVGSDQAQVTVGNVVKTVVLDTSIWQESDYPWRTFAPLRFVSEGLGCKVSWTGAGETSQIFSSHGADRPGRRLTQDEVCIVFFFPVREEDYIIVPGVRFGRLELRWSAEQVAAEAGLKHFVWFELVKTYQGPDDGLTLSDSDTPGVGPIGTPMGVLTCLVHSGKGIMKLQQGYLGNAPWGGHVFSTRYHTAEGITLGQKFNEETSEGNLPKEVAVTSDSSPEVLGYKIIYPGLLVWLNTERIVRGIEVVAFDNPFD